MVDIETTIRYLRYCQNYLGKRRTLIGKLQSIGENILDKNDEMIELKKSQNWFYLPFSLKNYASYTCNLTSRIQEILDARRFEILVTNTWVM